MSINSFIVNIVYVVIMEVFIGVLLPDGKMKKFVISVMSVFLLYVIVIPICESLKYII